MFYYSTFSWLRLQQETNFINIFKGRYLTSHRSHPSPDNFRETSAFYLRKQNDILFFHHFNTQLFVVPMKNLELNFYCQLFIRQRLLIMISETNKIKNNTVSIRYIAINFGREFNTKKTNWNHNVLFLRYQTQRMRSTEGTSRKHISFEFCVEQVANFLC